MDQFDAYFRRADLDHDGRISGAEAVAFFQGSNLPKPVLAQIWQHADHNHTGFLGRQEFYNALKLVTVAQSKRELTPDIVKAALYWPASSKIPAPQINLSALPPSQMAPTQQPGIANSIPPSQPNSMAPRPPSQQPGITSSIPPSQPNSMASRPPSQQPGIANSIPPSQPSLMAPRPTQQPGMANSIPPSQPNSMAPRPPTQQPGITNSIPPQTFGIRGQVPPNSMPVTSVSQPSPLQYFPSQNQSMGGPLPPQGVGAPNLLPGGGLTGPGSRPSLGSGNISDAMFGGDVFSASKSLSNPTQPATSEPPGQVKIDPLGALNAFTRQPTVVGPRPSQPGPTQNTSFGSSGYSVEVKTQAPNVSQTPNVSQPQWPKMTQAGVNKYMKVFMKVDSDRDGKITGEQARNLFMSWKLPREILKQVWDLSDQDNDSMLSLREFCIALYLMERYREGHNLPPTLPSNVLLDETLLSLTGPPNPTFRPPNWGPTSGHPPQQVMPGGQPMPHAGMRPPMPGPQPMPHQQRGPLPSMDTSHSPHLTNGDQNNNSISRETNESEKAGEDKKVILDSREKMTFFRNKMQDLVLYKSRCDNRLNEITERALADKREAELLAKKYEEKYKLVAEVASKLTIEEASFRDIQERKMELNQALVKMEQGGSADGILQVRADRIQSDLEELLKALSERCKKHGITVKSTAIIELPQGWQPGVPEISAVWDEDWDKFEDEGFSFDVVGPANPKSASQAENLSPNDNFDSYSNADVESEKYEDESAKSPAGSPTTQKIFESPTKEDSFSHFGKSFDADTDTQSGFDDQGWGTFDNNDDVDSVWGFNSEATKEPDHEKHGENYFFDSNSFTASPRRTDSPQKKSPFGFDDSVPGSPASRAGTSPRYSVGGAENSFFDNFSRYDSFSATDRGSPSRETFSRFDSMSSTTQDNNFSRFDSMSSTTQDRNFARFDSMSSSAGYDHGQAYSFDDSDPFGSSGPFKVSTESQTGKSESEKWAF
ncbi:hypothetical protein L2E82_36471 [Cichorium intybus]|uniref:Uncharacterized protein n=1 Tax=Cichorium intybus TaxID=13427 RepID=A0ACB9BRQ2_CICIN|nr:hypothetical protein L2E82_36471 [Cichorium intybus]